MTNLHLKPHDYGIYFFNVDLRHQYGISVAESQTFLLANRPSAARSEEKRRPFAGYLSSCQAPFLNLCLAVSTKQWIAPELKNSVCTKGPIALLSARLALYSVTGTVHEFWRKFLKKGCVHISQASTKLWHCAGATSVNAALGSISA